MRFVVVVAALTLTGSAWAQASLADGQKALERGEAAKALSIARELNRQMPDELDSWGLLVDAARALGQFDEAERAAQWMIDLRPEDPRGLWRVASLREDFGDLAGAEQMLVECYKRVPRTDTSWRAKLMRQMARLYTKTGRAEGAKRLVEEAERLEKP